MRYVLRDQTNRSTVWPVRAKSGVELLVGIDGVVTDEDLSDWVVQGLLVAIPVDEPVRNQLRIEPVAEIAPKPEPVVETEKTPVAVEPVVYTQNELASKAKSALWVLALQLEANAGLVFDKCTKAQIVEAILAKQQSV